ncbi:hypothetical protein BDAP_000958 [Binucleata daphniae]
MDKIHKFRITSLPSYVHRTLPVLSSTNNSAALPYTPLAQHILPSFFTFFSGPIAANLIYPNFSLTQDFFLSYLVGILIFYTLKLFPSLLIFSKLTPFIGRVFLVADMKNKNIPIHYACAWIMCNFLVSLVVNKIVHNKKIEMSNSEFTDLMGILFCLLISKHFMICDFYCAILVLFVDIASKIALYKQNSLEIDIAKRKMSLERIEIVKQNDKKKKTKKKDTKEEEQSLSEETKVVKRRGRPKKTDL